MKDSELKAFVESLKEDQRDELLRILRRKKIEQFSRKLRERVATKGISEEDIQRICEEVRQILYEKRDPSQPSSSGH